MSLSASASPFVRPETFNLMIVTPPICSEPKNRNDSAGTAHLAANSCWVAGLHKIFEAD